MFRTSNAGNKMLGTFDTGKEQFEEDYEAKALLQRGFNAQIVDDFVAYIHRVIPTATEKPLTILDLCCGDGGITKIILEKLTKSGIKVEKIAGYDISEAQIAVANKKYGKIPGLDFKVQDVTTMSDCAEYDVVISLFGLHWVENINQVAMKIQQALKENGKLMYFVPLEKAELFKLRQSIISSEEWKPYFTNYKFSPFRYQPIDYFQAFDNFFQAENANGISGTVTAEFSPEKLKTFLSSWMQELRHLDTEEKKIQYLDSLEEKLPFVEKGVEHDVEQSRGELSKTMYFHERIFWFHGTKKDSVSPDSGEAPNCLTDRGPGVR